MYWVPLLAVVVVVVVVLFVYCLLLNMSVCCVVDMADTLRYLLVGSGEITLENIEVMTYFVSFTITPVAKLQNRVVMLYVYLFILQLMSRSPSEVYEILSLARLAFCTPWGCGYLHIEYFTVSDILSFFSLLSPPLPSLPSFFLPSSFSPLLFPFSLLPQWNDASTA